MLYKEHKEVGNNKFMKTLKIICERDISYLEIPLIQTIIKYKWFAYTRDFFIKKFIVLMVFIFTFILDLLFQSKHVFDEGSSQLYPALLSVRIICILCVSFFGFYELI